MAGRLTAGDAVAHVRDALSLARLRGARLYRADISGDALTAVAGRFRR
ncbi:hypothetical protein Q5530_17140 [Saccharothrix sp. BKS2]